MEYARTPPPPISTGLRGRCPRCAEGRLFDGFLALKPACTRCGLDYGFIDAGDGPAFFVMSIVGILVVGLAFWLEVAYEPPLWLHALIEGPLAILLSLAMVRPLKGMLIALQYANKAEQGRFR